MTTQTAHCPRCGDKFPDGLEAKDFEGICPSCLAFLAVDKDSEEEALQEVRDLFSAFA